MRGAIVGFGVIAKGHMAGYARTEELSVVAAVDISPGRRHAAEAAGLRAYTDFAELLRAEDLDFVDICTPPNTHGYYSALGLAHGLHVLCEKPVFMPAEEGFKDLVGAVWNSDLVFYPCHVYKFAPILGSMKEMTRIPNFGGVLTANLRTLRHGHARGVPEWRPDWRRDPEISRGGILRDHGPHSIYLAMDLTGQSPLAVSCLTGRLRDDTYTDTEDTALLRIHCTNGAEVNTTLTWAADHRSTSYCIAGASGLINVDGDELTSNVHGGYQRSVIPSGFNDPSHKDWFADMLRDFVASVADPGRQDAIIREALMTAYVIEAAYLSAERNGDWLDVEVPAAVSRTDLPV